MESIAQIRDRIKACPETELAALLAEYASDEREGVRRLAEAGRRRIAAYEKEVARTEAMWHYERLYPDREFIGGIDEVGRGPLAGPVVVCCIVMPIFSAPSPIIAIAPAAQTMAINPSTIIML